MLDIKKIRPDFPILKKKRNNRSFIYFDNAATTQKPKLVIDTICDFYSNYNSNIQRGMYFFADKATTEFEKSRSIISSFLNTEFKEEIIFTSGTTHAINLVAFGFLQKFISKGDEVLIGEMEHHANIIPWQVVAGKLGAKFTKLKCRENGMVDIKQLKEKLNTNVKLIAVQHISNITGHENNIKEICALAHKKNIKVFVDGAQAGSHIKINVSELGCDFYCFSGHKLFGPTGTGALFVKEDILREMPPYKTGGQMVASVSFQGSKWIDYPLKFEAGTPNIAGAIGLGEAIKFIKNIDFQQLANYEQHLSILMAEKLAEIPLLEVYGNSKKVAPIFSFNIKNIHHYDLAELLSESGVLVRSGHLCNQSLMNFLKIDGCVRASLSIYNSEEEVNNFIQALKKVVKFLSKSI